MIRWAARLALLISLGFFALAFGFQGDWVALLVALASGFLGLAASPSERWGSRLASFPLVLASVLAVWGALTGADALLLGLALIATLIFWALARTPRADELRVIQLAARLRRLGALALLSVGSVILALYLPISLSFPAAFALAALAVGALLVVLRKASRLV